MNEKKHQLILSECLQLFALHGITVTKPLQRLIEFFFAEDRHLTVDDFQVYAAGHLPEISKEKIGEMLQLLVDYGFAQQKQFCDGKPVYEHLHLGEHHDHMYCVKCGTIVEFLSQGIEDLQLVEAQRLGFHALTHKLQIFGLCSTCFGQASQQLLPLAMADTGARFRVVDFSDTGATASKRFHDLGIIRNTQGEVVSSGSGKIIININGSRIAIGRGLAQKVRVTLV